MSLYTYIYIYIASLEAAYPAMGLSCAEVGGYISKSDSSKYAYGMEPCTDSSTQVRRVLFTIKLLHECFELLCSLLYLRGWVYVFYVDI
jgi:hypothetical protein